MAIPELLGEFGVDPACVLGKAGLGERGLADPDGWISFDTAGGLLSECIAATGCPHFGLLLGRRFSPATLGVVFQLMKHAGSLREALQSLVFHLHLHDRGGVGYVLHTFPGEIGLAYGIYHRGDFQVGPLYDFTAATIFSFMRELCGPRWKPTRISFAHRRPKNLSPYRRLFGAPLVFDAEHTAVFFAERWLDEPVHGSDPALQAAIAKLVSDRESAEALTMSDKVRRVLRTTVLAGTDLGGLGRFHVRDEPPLAASPATGRRNEPAGTRQRDPVRNRPATAERVRHAGRRDRSGAALRRCQCVLPGVQGLVRQGAARMAPGPQASERRCRQR